MDSLTERAARRVLSTLAESAADAGIERLVCVRRESGFSAEVAGAQGGPHRMEVQVTVQGSGVETAVAACPVGRPGRTNCVNS